MPHLGRAPCLVVAFLGCGLLARVQGHQAKLVWDHGSHTQASPQERALRALLARYDSGDVDGAVRIVLTGAVRWIPAAVDATLRRVDDEIKYHRRPENRLSAGDDNLERYLRADRLHVLLLAAALQVEASRAVNTIDAVGWLVLDSERAIDSLYALRGDFEQAGPVPWPVSIDEPWESRGGSARDTGGSVSWPAAHAFGCRWYSAAISRLQGLVELELTPALTARGLARCPGNPELLLARGSLVETRLALDQLDASLAPILYPSDVRQRWRNDLSGAERDFERAAQSIGPSSEAAVRLARVRLLKGQSDRAREQLDRVLSGEGPVEIRYLALLFRAATSERARDPETARRDYEAALRAVPGAQTAMLALARIADERNEPSEARRWVQRALSADAQGVDPWRRYIQGQAWQAGARAAALRTLEPH